MRAFVRICRAKGLKATHQRMEIFRELASSKEHPDAEAVYTNVRKRVPAISLNTVYRTVTTLEKHGLIHRAGTLSGSTRLDADIEPHHHFICTVCGAIMDFRSHSLNNLQIPSGLTALSTSHKCWFVVSVQHVPDAYLEQRSHLIFFGAIRVVKITR